MSGRGRGMRALLWGSLLLSVHILCAEARLFDRLLEGEQHGRPSVDLAENRRHGISAKEIHQVHKAHASLKDAHLYDHGKGMLHILAEKSKKEKKDIVAEKAKEKQEEDKEKKDEEDKVASGVDLMSEEQRARTILRCIQSDKAMKPMDVKAPNVSVGIYVTNLGSTDGLVSGVYYAEFLFYLMQDGKPLDDAMDQLSFSNAKTIASIKNYGSGTWLVSGDFFFSPDLRYYPFDSQELKIVVEQMEKPIMEFDFVPSDSNGLSPSVRFPGWLSSLHITEKSKHAPCKTTDGVRVYPGGAHDDIDSMNNVTFAKFAYQLKLERPVVQGVLTHLFPPIVVFLPTLYSYSLAPLKDALTKMSLSGGGLISLIFIWQGIKGGLPALDYLTAFDKYIVCFFVSISVALSFSIGTYANFGFIFGDKPPREIRERLMSLSQKVRLVSVVGTFFIFFPLWVFIGKTVMLPAGMITLALGVAWCHQEFQEIRNLIDPAELERLDPHTELSSRDNSVKGQPDKEKGAQ